jgi:hypothetical protein
MAVTIYTKMTSGQEMPLIRQFFNEINTYYWLSRCIKIVLCCKCGCGGIQKLINQFRLSDYLRRSDAISDGVDYVHNDTI